MIDRLVMGCVYGVTTGCHTSCYNMHQVYTQTTTRCHTDSYNSSVVYMYTLHAIGVTTGRNTDQPVYTHVHNDIFHCFKTTTVVETFGIFKISFFLVEITLESCFLHPKGFL